MDYEAIDFKNTLRLIKHYLILNFKLKPYPALNTGLIVVPVLYNTTAPLDRSIDLS